MNPSATVPTRTNDEDSLLQVGVYFTEVDHGQKIKYVPRSVQIDLEDGVLNRVSFAFEIDLPLRIPVSRGRAGRSSQSMCGLLTGAYGDQIVSLSR